MKNTSRPSSLTSRTYAWPWKLSCPNAEGFTFTSRPTVTVLVEFPVHPAYRTWFVISARIETVGGAS